MSGCDTPGPSDVMKQGHFRVRYWRPFIDTLEFFAVASGKTPVLAGGCVRDMFMAGHSLVRDYDVYITDVSDLERNRLMLMISQAIAALEPTYGAEAAIVSWPQAPKYASMPAHLRPVANIKLPWVERPIQVMLTMEKTAEDIAGRFDWRACAFAFDGKTVVDEGARDFLDGWSLRQAGELTLREHVYNPRDTLRRGFYLEEKYSKRQWKIRLSNESILALASMIILDGKEPKIGRGEG